MDGKVIKPFFDLSNPDDVYAIGDTFSGTAERINGLAEKGFVEKSKATPRKRQAVKTKE